MADAASKSENFEDEFERWRADVDAAAVEKPAPPAAGDKADAPAAPASPTCRVDALWDEHQRLVARWSAVEIKNCEMRSGRSARDGGRTSDEHERRAEERRNYAALHLFDLNTGPASFLSADGSSDPKEHPSDPEREAPGLRLSQRVFLAGPIVRQFDDQYLDDFCKSIADPRGVDGIHCLAGVRGSGKSTVLNRIEWYCRNWVRGTRPPLMIRFDLGCSYEPKRFLLDLMAEICRQVRSHVMGKPYTPFGWAGRLWSFTGNIGHWCASNMAWAIVLLSVYAIAFAANRFAGAVAPTPGATVTTGASPATTPAVAAPPATLAGARPPSTVDSIFAPATLKVLGMLVLGILTVGVMHSLRGRYVTRVRRQGVTGSAVALGLLGLLVSVMLVLLILALTTGTFAWAAYVSIGLLLLVALSQFTLPAWWWALTECDTLAASLRTRADNSTFELPGLAYVGSIARLLLPKPAATVDVRELDTPFQHQQIKDLLRHCTREFGRVVILIDDVDILPSQHFHDLFRTMRPSSKVNNVRVVVCAPRYFFHAFRSETLGDVHSTVRQVYMLGDPDLYDAQTPDFRLKPLFSNTFTNVLRAVLLSRLRIPLPRAIPPNATCKPIAHVIDRWNKDLTKDDWDRIKGYLGLVGATRRELLREIDRLLRTPGAKPFDFWPLKDDNLRILQRQVENLKSDYHHDETSLYADVVRRAAETEAKLKLIANPAM